MEEDKGQAVVRRRRALRNGYLLLLLPLKAAVSSPPSSPVPQIVPAEGMGAAPLPRPLCSAHTGKARIQHVGPEYLDLAPSAQEVSAGASL